MNRPRDVDPQKLFAATRPGDARPGGPATGGGRVKVLLALARGELDPPTRKWLEQCGLSIERAIADKITGSIDADNIPALRADPRIREIETAQRLHPKGGPPRT
jgi:hypothetical protein